MEYRRLGKSGLQLSALSLGSWLTFGNQISDHVADELMGMAYDAGVISLTMQKGMPVVNLKLLWERSLRRINGSGNHI